MKKYLTLCLAAALVSAFCMKPSFASPRVTQKLAAQEVEFKQRVVDWGTNKAVSVKLKSGEKIEGRIAEIKDEFFAVQLLRQGQISAKEVRYGEVKSLKARNGSHAGKIIGYAALGALAVLGILVLIGLSLDD